MAQLWSRLSWGFARTSTGTLVIHNWYRLFGSLLVACFCFLLSLPCLILSGGTLAAAGNGGQVVASLFFAFIGLLLLYPAWIFYLELRGVRVTDKFISYPVRLGLGPGIFPLFPKSIPMEEVLQASSLRKKRGIMIAYLSGEFGEAKIVFDTKGGRDRLFTLLKEKFPHIKIYRWM